jgi:hypothetical protein
MPLISVTFVPVPGDWGSQIGWLDALLLSYLPGLTIRRMPVFRHGPASFTYGSPLVPGDLPASRFCAVTFTTDEDRAHFMAALQEAFRAACPELFLSEGAA